MTAVVMDPRIDAAMPLTPETRAALVEALKLEAFEHVKYMLFAAHARRGGNAPLAERFERIAAVERDEHFAELAALVGLVGSDVQNLVDAISGASHDAFAVYREYADRAAAAGDLAAAVALEKILGDEEDHRDEFTEALAVLERERNLDPEC